MSFSWLAGLANNPVSTLIISLVSVLISILITAYFSDKATIFFRGGKYRHLTGKYKLYNYSREGKNRFHEWDVTIRKLPLRTPKFRAAYVGMGEATHIYEGSIVISGEIMTVHMWDTRRGYTDRSFMAFNAPEGEKIDIEVGILCGFRSPVAPYAGVHILCAPEWTKQEIQGLFPPYAPRSDGENTQIDLTPDSIKERAIGLIRRTRLQ